MPKHAIEIDFNARATAHLEDDGSFSCEVFYHVPYQAGSERRVSVAITVADEVADQIRTLMDQAISDHLQEGMAEGMRHAHEAATVAQRLGESILAHATDEKV